MKLGLIADVHADADALQKALDLLDAQGAAGILCAGDLVSFGDKPNRALKLLRKRGVISVRGNHDRKSLKRKFKRLKPHHTDISTLKPKNLAYLKSLPFSRRRRYGELRLLLCHATPHDDQGLLHPRFETFETMTALLREARVDVMVVGHLHLPVYVETPAGLIINPGSVMGNYSDWMSGSCTCGLLDTETLDYSLFDIAAGRPDPRLNWPWWEK